MVLFTKGVFEEEPEEKTEGKFPHVGVVGLMLPLDPLGVQVGL